MSARARERAGAPSQRRRGATGRSACRRGEVSLRSRHSYDSPSWCHDTCACPSKVSVPRPSAIVGRLGLEAGAGPLFRVLQAPAWSCFRFDTARPTVRGHGGPRGCVRAWDFLVTRASRATECLGSGGLCEPAPLGPSISSISLKQLCQGL